MIFICDYPWLNVNACLTLKGGEIDDLEKKKMRAVLELMGMKKAQKVQHKTLLHPFHKVY